MVQVARHFAVDPATVRRWIQRGCPCVQVGRRGPGGSAVLNLEAVAAWRGQASVSTGWTADEVLERIAVALERALTVDRADIRAGIERASCAAAYLAAFEGCSRELGKTYRFDHLPEPIRALMREL